MKFSGTIFIKLLLLELISFKYDIFFGIESFWKPRPFNVNPLLLNSTSKLKPRR